MITRDTLKFLDELERGRLVADGPAVPQGVFVVEPLNFRVSTETAVDNRYMDPAKPVDPDRALEQYLELVSLIREAGVPVKTFPGDARTPDDVFPNNAFGTAPRRLIIGRMLHANRRLETQREDIRRYFRELGYQITDLSAEDCVAELTGPLVIDRPRHIGYCGMTSRVDEAGLQAMHKAFGLRCTLQFDLAANEYHTNVVFSVLAGRVGVLHAGSFADARVPFAIAAAYGGRVLYLDDKEKAAFAGNCIALTRHDVFMSRTAAAALHPSNRALLESWGFRIRATALDEIEKAGGSLRCMVAEIY
jgi:hypothetical protein